MSALRASPQAHRESAIDHAALLERCARGDRSALRILYEAEAGLMLGVALRILRCRHLAEEAVHDAFVQIWCKASSFRPERCAAPRAWLIAVVRNRALSILRARARDDLVDDPEALDRADDANQAHPEAIMAGLSDTSRLRHCLAAMEPRKRDSILLAFIHGLTHGEVAVRLGVPLGTAKSWIRRGLLALREDLERA